MYNLSYFFDNHALAFRRLNMLHKQKKKKKIITEEENKKEKEAQHAAVNY